MATDLFVPYSAGRQRISGSHGMDQTDTIGIGKADAAEAAHNTPDQTKPSLLDIFLSRLKSAFIINTIISLFSIASISAIFPVVITILYSISNGLPFFEIISIIGENAYLIFSISTTIFIITLIVLFSPGLLTFLAEKSAKISNFNEIDEIYALQFFRWAKIYFPGLICSEITLIIIYLSSYHDKNELKIEYYIFSISILVTSIIMYLIEKKKFKRYKGIIITTNNNNNKFYIILFTVVTNFLGFIYSLMIISLLSISFSKSYSYNSFKIVDFYTSNNPSSLVSGLMVGFATYVIYKIITTWPNKIKLKTSFLYQNFCYLLFYYYR